LDAAPAQSRVAADRIAPVRVAAVGDDVAGIEDGAQLIERLVDRRSGRDVEQDDARTLQGSREIGEGLGRDQSGERQVGRRLALAEARDSELLGESLAGEIAAHLSQADDSEYGAS
jgi:hypothetical protein